MTFNFDRKANKKIQMPLCHFDSYNLWLLKPTHLNRGRGIHVFRDIDTLNKLIKQYCTGRELENLKKKEPITQIIEPEIVLPTTALREENNQVI